MSSCQYPEIRTGARVRVHSRWGDEWSDNGMTGRVCGRSNEAPGCWRVQTDNGNIAVYRPEELEVL